MTFCYRFFHVEKVCIVESVVKGHFVTHIKKCMHRIARISGHKKMMIVCMFS